MLCQICHQNPATIHLTTNVNGQQTTLDLCQKDYQLLKERSSQNGGLSALMQDPFGFGNLDDIMLNMNCNGGSALDHFGWNITIS